MKQKKAIGIGTLIIIIIVVAGGVVLIAFSGKLAALIGGGVPDEVCRLSILAQAKTKVVGESPIGIDCPRKKIIFYKDHVEEIVKGKKNVKKFDELDDETVNKVIAEELRKCWRKTGEGEIDAFEEGELLGTNVCLLCSSIEFDGSVTKSFSGLADYLESHKIKEEDETYLQYLSKIKRATLLRVLYEEYKTFLTQNVNRIDPDENYAVFMKAFKTNVFLKFLWNNEDKYLILIGPGDWITRKDVCDVLLN